MKCISSGVATGMVEPSVASGKYTGITAQTEMVFDLKPGEQRDIQVQS